MIRSAKIRKSARGESCTMYSVNCNRNRDTVVWCHSNLSIHGKGHGLKAHDIFGFYGCSGCHDWYDGRTLMSRGTAAEKRELFFMAHARSLLRLVEKGLVQVA